MSDFAIATGDQDQLDDYRSDAIFLGSLILIAYEMASDPNNLNPPQPSNFPKGYRLLANILMKDFLFGYDFYQWYGFLAIKDGTGEVLIIIRGTFSIAEWIDDLYSIYPVPFLKYGMVGDAWAKIYHTMRTTPRNVQMTSEEVSRMETGGFAAQVAEVVKAHLGESRLDATSASMDCAGHSLGSALITLYTLDRRGEDATYPIRKFYTFASPLVGDRTFKTAFDRLPFAKYRIFNTSDPVPNLPPYVGFVPVDVAERYVLPANYYSWALCSHSMNTYMNLLDPSKYAPAYYCTHIIPTPHQAGRASGPGEAAAEPALAVERTSRGGTKITITIEAAS